MLLVQFLYSPISEASDEADGTDGTEETLTIPSSVPSVSLVPSVCSVSTIPLNLRILLHVPAYLFFQCVEGFGAAGLDTDR